jgi:Transposase and inactivated derivatives
MGQKRTRHATYDINYHFVWTPKFRRKVLTGAVARRLRELIVEKTNELGGEVLDLSVQPDHVHLFCSFPPTIAPHQVMYRIKGYTAFKLRSEFPSLKSRLPCMWTRFYYVGTAGSVSSETIERYLEVQKGK